MSEKHDWKIMRWFAEVGLEREWGVYRAIGSPWEEFKLARTVPMEVRAIVYSTTKEKAQAVLEILSLP